MGVKSRKQATRASNVANAITKKPSGKQSTGKKVKRPVASDTIQPTSHIHWMDILLLSTAIFSGYLFTLYPSIAGGDSGELVAESCHLGISHPPGYPLFTMLVYVITAVLPGEPSSRAWKANAFAAAADTGCAVLIYLIVASWTTQRVAGVTASMLFAFSPLIWTYAIGAEVFSVNNLFVTALLYILTRFAQAENTSNLKLKLKYAQLGAFVSGLAMCNQHTIILLEIPIVVYVLASLRPGWRTLSQLAMCFGFGLVPYVYIPLSSWLNPQPGSWGDVSTISGFFHHLRRADYGTFKLFSTNQVSEGLQERLFFYFRDLCIRETLYIGPGFALLGILASIRSPWRNMGWCLLFSFLFYMIVFHTLSNMPLGQGLLYGVHRRFWQQPNVLVFIWIGLGLASIPSHIVKSLMCLTMIGFQILLWFPLCNQSQAYFISNYAHALLDPLPRDALVLVNYDLQWTSLRYIQECEGYRPDITIINLSMMTYAWFQSKHEQYPHLHFPGTHLVRASSSSTPSAGFSIKDFFDHNSPNVKIYIGGQISYPDDDFFQAYTSMPLGLLSRYVAKSKSLSLDQWYWENHQAMQLVHQWLPDLPSDDQYDEETWEWTIARDYHMHTTEHATYLLDEIIQHNASIPLLLQAVKPMEYSLRHEPTEFQPSALRKNLGLAYAYMVKSSDPIETSDDSFPEFVGHPDIPLTDYKKRASHRMLELWSTWLQSPSAAQDPSYSTIQGIVTSLKKH